MHDDRKSPGSDESDWVSPDREDARWQARVVTALLAQSPHSLSGAELARELLKAEPEFPERDALTRAIRDLRQAGIVHQADALVSLTRAARHFNALPFDEQ